MPYQTMPRILGCRTIHDFKCERRNRLLKAASQRELVCLPSNLDFELVWGDLDQDQWSKICLDHGASKYPMNPWPAWFHRFLWCTMIQVILDHQSWPDHPKGTCQKTCLRETFDSWFQDSWYSLVTSSISFNLIYGFGYVYLQFKPCWGTSLGQPWNTSEAIW